MSFRALVGFRWFPPLVFGAERKFETICLRNPAMRAAVEVCLITKKVAAIMAHQDLRKGSGPGKPIRNACNDPVSCGRPRHGPRPLLPFQGGCYEGSGAARFSTCARRQRSRS